MISMTKIYGHRGAKGMYPENTLLSFKKAIDQGVDGLELDVHLTKDGEVVVIHDETLDRTTNGTGWIKDLTLAEIKQVSAGSKFSHFPYYQAGWDKEQVPTLKEVLELLEPYHIELNIELKTNDVVYEKIEEKVHELVQKYGSGREVIYSSFHLPTILRMKKIDPAAKIAWLLNEGISLPHDYLNTLELEALHLNKSIILPNKKTIQQITRLIQVKNVGFPKEVKEFFRFKMHSDYHQLLKEIYHKVRVWTVNEPDQISRLLDIKVNAIITDFPERAISIRNERKPLK
jgi:glycerophosphoryl diester phosphodiesterase